MRFRNYIWDFDGTVFDTYPHITASMVHAFRSFGTEPDFTEVYRRLKSSVGETVEYYCGKNGLNSEEVLARFTAFRREDATAEERLFPDAAETFRVLTERGARHFMLTHRGPSSKVILGKAGLLRYFTEIIDASMGFPRKPSPAAIEYLVGKYGLVPDETVMVGDRPLDMEAGSRAGIRTMFFDPDGFFPDYPCTVHVEGMREIAEG